MWLKWKYRLLKRFWFLTLPLWRRRGLWLRTLLCWSVGLVALHFNEIKSFDTRLSLRGPNNFNPDVVILNITQKDRDTFFQQNTTHFSSDSPLPDNLYWSKNTWLNLIQILLKENPKGIAITFFFGDNIPKVSLSTKEKSILTHPTVIWSTHLDSRGRVILPQFANEYRDNIGIGELHIEKDSVLRSFSSPLVGTPHITARMSEKVDPRPSIEYVFPTSRLINFRGPKETFPQVNLTETLNGKVPSGFFKNKLVIIGADTVPGHQFLTPLGLMSRGEVMAHVTDNILNRRWVEHLDFKWYYLYLFIILILSIFVMKRYPSQATIIFIGAIFIFCLGFSILLFDTYYLWLPVLAPSIQLVFTWVTFMGLQASIVERKNWRLRQEQLYLRKVEELKSNFVSLISHDLKTPIAKIQAVVDRLSTQNPNHEFSQDLKSMRTYSEELHRYIRSILQIIKVESKDFQLNLQIAEINEIIDSAVTKLLPISHQKKLQINTQLEPMFSVEFDTILILEVIINLIENAIKYTPENGTITIYSKEVQDKVFVNVTDTGPGISPSEQKNIWNKFVRGKEQDLKTKGTGLGLYLVKYFVELHGGEVFLESYLGKGTKIGFWLPVESDIDIERPLDIEEYEDI